MFKHILVPTDGSQFSQHVARNAVSFAKEVGALITAFYVKPKHPLSYYSEEDEATPPGVLEKQTEFEKQTEQAAQEFLGYVDKLCREAGVSCTRLTVTNGVIYEAIIEAATKNGCDLIFMASHGRSGLGALLLGSETNKVLAHTKIPVLVYR